VSRGRTTRGRSRAGFTAAAPTAKPLLHTEDEGRPVRIDARTVGAQGDRWIDPFLAANEPALQRLDLSPQVHSAGGLHLELRPSGRIGAVPLVAPATRRVCAGLLVSPRFRWSALGNVMSSVGFSVAPTLGGGALVPGSAREVPPWLIAGPVVRRIESLLAHRHSSFVRRREERRSPRGRVDWGTWARVQVPVGRWTALPCEFSDLADDPDLMAAVRWTLHRLDDDLSRESGVGPARLLRARIDALQGAIGEGPAVRPSAPTSPAFDVWAGDAVEAMGWVADERGLGGARELDGLAWDLVVAEVWEEWVRSFARDLAPRLGLLGPGEGALRRPLRWEGSVTSMGSLAPDVGLRGEDRTIWLDAKYKAHLTLLRRHGWTALSETVRGEHRADLHQALAYAALADVDRVDTVLVYPSLGSDHPDPLAIATVASGRRRVRLVLAALPFGFATPSQREAAVATWRALLAA
jgi:hypothetical protein